MRRSWIGGVMIVGVVVGCGEDVMPPDESAEFQQIIDEFQLSSLPDIPYPADNQFNPDRIRLGLLLFFDPILGGESGPRVKEAAGLDPYRNRANDMACATCHFPTLGFGDRRRISAGVSGQQHGDLALGPDRVVPGPALPTGVPVGIVPRNAPTVLNTAFNGRESIEPSADGLQFLDGRAAGLEEQASLPFLSRDEMAGDAFLGLTNQEVWDSLALRVQAIPAYVTMFVDAFPGEVTVAGDITINHIIRAIGAYEREIITPDSRYDQFVDGNYDVFSREEKDGFKLFYGKGLCGECHNGPMLSNYEFEVVGAGDAYELAQPGFQGKNGAGSDFGRFHADPNQFGDQKFAFRTMTIRNVEVTGPYFHSGSATTLRDVVEFYNSPGLLAGDLTDGQLAAEGATRSPFVRELGLTPVEIDRIVAFMRTTTAPVQAGPDGMDLTEVPTRVPSGLLPPGIPTPPGNGPFFPTGN